MATPSPSVHHPAVEWRSMGEKDLEEIAPLEAAIHAAPWTIGNFRDALAAGYSATIGLYNGRVVAYGVLLLGPSEAQVLNLSVIPDARRQGVGRTLLRSFVDDAREHGAL